MEQIALEKLGIDVIDGDRGKNYPHQDELLEKGDCLFLSAKNVTTNGFDFSNNQFIISEKDEMLRNGKLTRGDIVITTRGTVGNVALYDDSVPYDSIRINSGMLIVRCGDNLSREYIYIVLRSSWFLQKIRSIQTGSAQPQLPKSHFLKMEIPVPDKVIQDKIAVVIMQFDRKMACNSAINRNLEEQALALYYRMFVETKNDGRTICRTDEFFEITIGKTPPRKEKEWFSEIPSDCVWISISDMGSSGTFINDSSEYLTPEAVEKFNVKVVPDNTVILSFKLTVGRIAITVGPTTTNEAIAHFNTDNQKIVEYLYCYLKSFDFGALGSTSSIGIAVNSKTIKAMDFLIPEDGELQEFFDIVHPMFQQIKNNQFEKSEIDSNERLFITQAYVRRIRCF